MLQCARADAASGQLDVKRLGRLLQRIRGRIRRLELGRVSPFAVPVLLEIGREPVFGAAHPAPGGQHGLPRDGFRLLLLDQARGRIAGRLE